MLASADLLPRELLPVTDPRPSLPAPVTVVALHGNGGGGSRFARAAAHLGARVRLVAPTLPGFGNVPADPAIRSLRGCADWVARELERHPRPRVLLGHGIGGSIALEVLQHHAHLVDGVILQSPVGARLAQRRFPKLMKLPGMRTLARRMLAMRILRGLWTRRLFDGASPEGAVPREHLDAFFEGYRRCALFGAMFDWITAAWFEQLRPVAVPAVLWWGGSERVLAPEHAAAFARLLPGSRTVVEPGWGHFPMLDRPRAWAARLEQVACELATARGVRA